MLAFREYVGTQPEESPFRPPHTLSNPGTVRIRAGTCRLSGLQLAEQPKIIIIKQRQRRKGSATHVGVQPCAQFIVAELTHPTQATTDNRADPPFDVAHYVRLCLAKTDHNLERGFAHLLGFLIQFVVIWGNPIRCGWKGKALCSQKWPCHCGGRPRVS